MEEAIEKKSFFSTINPFELVAVNFFIAKRILIICSQCVKKQY